MHVVGDAAYVGERLCDGDDRISWTSRLKVTSVLHELPPPRTGRSGRPRTRGARLGTPADVAALATNTNTCGSGIVSPSRSEWLPEGKYGGESLPASRLVRHNYSVDPSLRIVN